MIPLRNINNGALVFTKAMPNKDLTSDNQSSFSLSRRSYAKTYSEKTTKEWFGGSKNRDSSSVINNRKKNAVGGGSLNANEELMSFTKLDNVQGENQALQRVRNSGYVVPLKTTAQNSINMTPYF